MLAIQQPALLYSSNNVVMWYIVGLISQKNANNAVWVSAGSLSKKSLPSSFACALPFITIVRTKTRERQSGGYQQAKQ